MLPRTRILLALWMILMIMVSTLKTQHLSSARTAAIGGATALTTDHGSLDWNPAGLVFMKDWHITATNYYPFFGSDRSMVLQLLSIGKRFMNNHAASLRFSPGTTVEFVVPSSITIQDSSSSFTTTVDKEIRYQERYALGYAVRPRSDISVGFSFHFLEENVTDTKYTLDTNSVLRLSKIEDEGNFWLLDWGMLWTIDPTFRVGGSVKNLVRITEKDLDESAQEFRLKTPKLLTASVAVTMDKNFVVGFDISTNKKMRLGGEWNFLESAFLRNGWYADWNSAFTVEAVSLGAGVAYHPVHVDVNYLLFTSQQNRQGAANLSLFEEKGIDNLDINPFSPNKISLTVSIDVGRTREPLARIEYVEMLSDVFPASSTVYAFRPIGKARVKNVSNATIEAKVSFFVDKFMDEPTISKPRTIFPGEVVEVPLYAVFNQTLRSVSSFLIQNGDVFVHASYAEEYDDRYQTKVLVHGRNDWNGDVTMLRFFMTPDEPEILQYTRSVLEKYKTHLDSVPNELQKFEQAKLLFDDFAHRMQYIEDPRKSQDHVQYPSETLQLRSGDCDDMTVCFATILASVGIETAFIDVVPPEHPENSHIYLMVHTGVEAHRAHLVSENPKRLIVRGNSDTTQSVWIPIETTSLKQGFSEAWTVGAQEYYNDVELNFGLAKGWVKIVDVQPTY